MTATCRQFCCNVTAGYSVTELFERGYRRLRDAPLALQGPPRVDADGNFAAFSLDIADGRILRAGFRSTSCATLIAYCELVAETVPSFRPAIARALTANEIVNALPGVPPLKQNRSTLAVAAFHSALNLIPIELGELCYESRLHLRHPAP